jgi:hypothetical protein
MKKIGLIILLLLFIKSGWTQNANLDYKNAIKIYNLTSFEEYNKSKKPDDTSSNNLYYTTTMLQILQPTIAFQWKTKKNNFHEIEITSFMLGKLGTKTEIKNESTNIGQTISGNDVISTSISARYEYILNLNKSKDRKLVPSLGFGTNPYYRQNRYLPKISSSFPTSEKYLGVKLFLTPRLSYYLTSKFFIDINIPICIGEIYYTIDKDENPTLTVKQRTTSSVDFREFPNIFSGRIGIGLKI